MAHPLPTDPSTVCMLRLSAIGDVCHALPVLRTLQGHWPEARFTWIIGETEARLIGDVPEVEFIRFPKSQGPGAFRSLRLALRGRRFDLLLHMQNSMRGNLASLLVRAPARLGFHRSQCKDQQWLFTNHRTAEKTDGHVMDVLFGFAEACGARDRILRWDIPVPDEARRFAAEKLLEGRRHLLISPCANPRHRSWRSWTPEGYAAVADHAARHHGMGVVLTGGPSELERDMGHAILRAARSSPVDLIGRSDLKQLLALLERAAVLVCPDSGPAHMATAVGTPVISLFASTNPDRAAPYFSRRWTVNRYAETLAGETGLTVDQVPFGRRVRSPTAMHYIEPEDVCEMLDAFCQAAPARTS